MQLTDFQEQTNKQNNYHKTEHTQALEHPGFYSDKKAISSALFMCGGVVTALEVN